MAIGTIALLLVACGGDDSSSNGTDSAEAGDIMADTFEDLLVCTTKREGAVAYVKNKKTAYICINGDWVIDGDESSDSCSGGSSSSIMNDRDESCSSIASLIFSSSQSLGFSSSSSVELNCSVILEADGWSWDIPKECCLNPDIAYGRMIDRRDNKVYKTITIGSQTWMAENLNYADSMKTPSLLKRSWCYNNVDEYCAVTGRLYTWAAAIDSMKYAMDVDDPQDCGYGTTCTLPTKVQGICPDGWHLPSIAEWNTLLTYLGGSLVAGTKLKSTSGWKGNANDAIGFSALPAGIRRNKGDFDYDGDYAYFWSATDVSSNNASDIYLYYGYGNAVLDSYNKNFAYSVRCLQD